MSRIHWSAPSGLTLPSKRDGWYCRKSSKLHSCTRGSEAWEEPAAKQFSPIWCRASKCLYWVASAASLADSIYCKARFCWFTMLAFCCCMAAIIASIAPTKWGLSGFGIGGGGGLGAIVLITQGRNHQISQQVLQPYQTRYEEHATETKQAHTYKS